MWYPKKTKEVEIVDNKTFIAAYDAVEKYLNVDTDQGIVLVVLALYNCIFIVILDWPRKQIMLAIELALKCDVFQFGDSFCGQKCGGAMVNLMAALWAVIYFVVL